MTSPAPTQLDVALSPAWLSRVLSPPGELIPIDAVRVVETLKTMATKVRIEIDAPSAPPSFGRTLCVKGFFEDTLHPRLALNSAQEAHFYLDVAAGSGVRAPNCRYAAIDPETGHGIVVMDDVVAAGGRFLTALDPYSADQAAASLDQLARLHALGWNGAGPERYPWLTSRLAEMASASLLPLPLLQELMDGERSRPLPAEITDAGRIHRGLVGVARLAEAEPTTLVHGDAHAGNIFELDGGAGLIDWQLLQRSSWAIDVSYHIGAALSVEDRAKSEQVLLRHYLERLRAHGAEPPGWDQAWAAYRSHMLYGYYLWCITRRVEPPIIHEFVRRLGLAVVELESFRLAGA